MLELDPRYVDVVVERWQGETGRDATLDDDGRSFAALKSERLGAAAQMRASPRDTMRVLVACEFSGVVRDAFRARGHYAVSCDLLPSERPGPHLIGEVRDHFADGWDLLIAHPPCTFLANSGAKHLYLGCRRENGAAGDRWANLGHAAAFFLDMLRAPVPRIAVENPIMLGHVRRLFDIPAPSQTIQPWEFGHPETKATCLWLKGLPRLTPTAVVEGREARVHREPPGPDRWRNRSRTYPGIAAAMAEQWGAV
jgi:hypothetical protein